MLSTSSIISDALRRARATAGGSEKNASAENDLVKTAQQLADANEFIALRLVEDGTPEGQVKKASLENFLKHGDSQQIKGPGESVAPSGTQAVPPQEGKTKILPAGKPSKDHPEESVAPTGHQATLDQTPKKAGMTLLDLITKQADSQQINGPGESVSGQNAAAPPAKNENTNIDLVRSAEAIVNATKRDAKLPTRARLAQLFAHAGDTGPSSAAAHAAFPNAAEKGGLKVADSQEEIDRARDAVDDKLMRASNRGWRETSQGSGQVGMHSGGGAVSGAAAGALGGSAKGVTVGAPLGAIGGLVHGLAHGSGSLSRRIGKAGLSTAVGAAGGMTAGGLLGAGPGALAGGISGAIHGHHEGERYRSAVRDAEREHKALDRREEKVASLGDYLNLFKAAAAGELGDEGKDFAEFIEGIVA